MRKTPDQTRYIRTISLWQPWASAMAYKLKMNETRGWPTDYRGPLAIHAAMRRVHWHEVESAVWKRLENYGIYDAAHLPFGKIVCVTNLIDVKPTEEVKDGLDDMEAMLGKYEANRFAWQTSGCERLLVPIPEAGKQRFWHWTPPDDFELKFEPGETVNSLVLTGDESARKAEAMRRTFDANGRWVRK